MSIKLRDLIRAVRACKTAAEERAVISKECALIRTAIKEENETFRHRNVAKLMYIHMLGYPTHFGQMECLKLISAQSFPEKRIGYLGLTLLLTENTEVLMLVTNSLKVDLTNQNQYIVALSLIAIGNLSTQDMARDVASDVEKLLRSNNSYLRKKAALATIRLLKKEPDLIEHMSERIVGLLKDRSHGVLITGIQLMTEVIEQQPEMADEYRRLVPSLVRLLRNFISMGYSPEHDVSGITDPFLQVKLLRLLRYLGKGNEEASDHMNDVLAQVATNTETAKNAGNAILYECVMTIMEVNSDSGLRVLAVNILGRFLLNRDNNIRYVALNTLSKVVSEDIGAVQRHRATIVDCLKDSDISIRQRALELIFQLINETNVEALTTELLNYLVIAQSDHKGPIVSRLMEVIEKYSPNKKWRVDTIISLLSFAGNQCDESTPRTAIIFIAQSDGLQGYSVHRLYTTLQEDTSQTSLVHVGIWCIGEYGDLLVRPCNEGNQDFPAIPESTIVSFLDSCLRLHNTDITTKSFVLNALLKLSVRASPSVRPAILNIISTFRSSMVLELQQRGSEYTTLLSSQWDRLRGDLLGKMPVLDEATLRKRRAVLDENSVGDMMATQEGGFGDAARTLSAAPVGAPIAQAPAAPAAGGGGFLLDLDDIFGGGAPAAAPVAAFSTPVPSGGGDLLSDIFSMGAAPTPQPVVQMGMSQPVPMQQIFSPPAPPSNPIVKALEKNGMTIELELSKPNPASPASTNIVCRFSNSTQSPMSNLVFQVCIIAVYIGVPCQV
jgi:AP-1 complex subunit gamma-1